jgi:hypothetical protein
MTKKKIMMAKLIAENFDQFGHAITHQRRRGALPQSRPGRRSKIGKCFADIKIFKTAPVLLT